MQGPPTLVSTDAYGMVTGYGAFILYRTWGDSFMFLVHGHIVTCFRCQTEGVWG